MIILLIIGVVLTGLAIGSLARGIVWPRQVRSVGVPRRVEEYGFTRREHDEEGSGGLRDKIDDVATKLGAAVGGRSGPDRFIKKDLISAGLYHVTPGRFLGYRVLSALAFPILWIWLGAAAGVKAVPLVVLTLVIGFLGWWMPARILRERANQRMNEIDYQLPELIDLLVVTIEAGLGFVGSLQMAAGRISNPLGEEVQLTLQEQSMGLSIQEALLNMLARCDTPSMRSFVRSIVQGETLGVSIGQIMRDLAQEMRRRRRAVAQEKAQKAPIKILFPLVLLIFPAMFVILLGPAMFLFFHAMSGTATGP
ncbi:MAG TPA: type II secretion system F family protein [Gemmatimonadaceae bacterium]|nr:type II secretion system F family protein [Gemmatimonadaceae bacterium]